MYYKGKATPRAGLDRPLGFQDVEAPRFSQLAHECGKIISPTHRPPLSTRIYSWYSFLFEADSNPGSYFGRKDYVNKKLGIEPANFRLVAQCPARYIQLLY